MLYITCSSYNLLIPITTGCELVVSCQEQDMHVWPWLHINIAHIHHFHPFQNWCQTEKPKTKRYRNFLLLPAEWDMQKIESESCGVCTLPHLQCLVHQVESDQEVMAVTGQDYTSASQKCYWKNKYGVLNTQCMHKSIIVCKKVHTMVQ